MIRGGSNAFKDRRRLTSVISSAVFWSVSISTGTLSFIYWLERAHNFNCFWRLNCFWNWRYFSKRYCRYLFFRNNSLTHITWFAKTSLFDWILANRIQTRFFQLYSMPLDDHAAINVAFAILLITIVLYFFGTINYRFPFETFGLENSERHLFSFTHSRIATITDMFKLSTFYQVL